MQEVLIEELLDRTYHISKKINDNNEFERDEEIQKAYDQIKEEVFSKETNLDKVNQNTDVFYTYNFGYYFMYLGIMLVIGTLLYYPLLIILVIDCLNLSGLS